MMRCSIIPKPHITVSEVVVISTRSHGFLLLNKMKEALGRGLFQLAGNEEQFLHSPTSSKAKT